MIIPGRGCYGRGPHAQPIRQDLSRRKAGLKRTSAPFWPRVTKNRCFSSGLTTRKRCRLAKRCRLLWTRQDLRAHHVHWMASREGQDLVNCCAQQCLIIIPLNVAEMRGAERVCHPNQRVPGAQHRLILVDVHGRRTRLTLVEGCRQRAALDDLRPTGVDEKRSRLHARQILRRHDAVRLGVQRKVQAEHVCCGEEFFAAWSNLKTRLACPRHRTFPTPHSMAYADG